MHEIGMIQQALGVALECAARQGARRVERVTCRVGVESGVDLDVIDFIFPLATEGTIAEGAALEIVRVAARCRCPACGEEFAPEDLLHLCPRCGRAGAELLAGKEFGVAALDVV